MCHPQRHDLPEKLQRSGSGLSSQGFSGDKGCRLLVVNALHE